MPREREQGSTGVQDGAHGDREDRRDRRTASRRPGATLRCRVTGPTLIDAALVTTYADLRLGGTDASVVALAGRRGASRIAMLNRRHFAVVRPRHANAFELLP